MRPVVIAPITAAKKPASLSMIVEDDEMESLRNGQRTIPNSMKIMATSSMENRTAEMKRNGASLKEEIASPDGESNAKPRKRTKTKLLEKMKAR